MANNPYFNFFNNKSEQGLTNDLTAESIKQYAHNVYYLPRTIDKNDDVLNEPIIQTFSIALPVEMYIKNFSNFEGQGQLLTKFGLEIRDQMTFILSKKSFEQFIQPTTKKMRPFEGDCIYIPMFKNIYQIKYTDMNQDFYVLGDNYSWNITCELLEFNNEIFETGIPEIDNVNKPFGNANDPDYNLDDYDMTNQNKLMGDKANQILGLNYGDTPINDYMTKTIYDPRNLQKDVFSRANHTGNIGVGNISGLGGLAIKNLVALEDINTSNQPDGDLFLRGDGVWADIPAGGSEIPSSRKINTTNGIIGGGTLADDLTLSLDANTTNSLIKANSAVQPDDFSNNSFKVNTTTFALSAIDLSDSVKASLQKAENSVSANIFSNTSFNVSNTNIDLSDSIKNDLNLANTAIQTGNVQINDIVARGTANSTTYLSGDGSWKFIQSGGGGSTGDMLKAVYDPNNVSADSFDMDNMKDGNTNFVFTKTDKNSLLNIANTYTNYNNFDSSYFIANSSQITFSSSLETKINTWSNGLTFSSLSNDFNMNADTTKPGTYQLQLTQENINSLKLANTAIQNTNFDDRYFSVANNDISLSDTVTNILGGVADAYIITGNGLTGGGGIIGGLTPIELNANSINSLKLANTSLQPGEVNISDLKTTGNANSMTFLSGDFTWKTVSSGGEVPASRNILTGNGLTGGGDLSADRTISLDANTVTAINSSAKSNTNIDTTYGYMVFETNANNIANSNNFKFDLSQDGYLGFNDFVRTNYWERAGGAAITTRTPTVDSNGVVTNYANVTVHELAFKDKIDIVDVNASGTANSTTFLSGSGSWDQITVRNISSLNGYGNSSTVLYGDGYWKYVVGPDNFDFSYFDNSNAQYITLNANTISILYKANSAIQPGNVQINDIKAIGTPNSSTVLYGDGTWSPILSSGDMLKTTYDPKGVGNDAFDMDNMRDGNTNFVFTSTDKTTLNTISSDYVKSTNFNNSYFNANTTNVTLASNVITNLGLAQTAIQTGNVAISDIKVNGTANTSTYLRGDGTWATVVGGGGGGVSSFTQLSDVPQSYVGANNQILSVKMTEDGLTFTTLGKLAYKDTITSINDFTANTAFFISALQNTTMLFFSNTGNVANNTSLYNISISDFFKYGAINGFNVSNNALNFKNWDPGEYYNISSPEPEFIYRTPLNTTTRLNKSQLFSIIGDPYISNFAAMTANSSTFYTLNFSLGYNTQFWGSLKNGTIISVSNNNVIPANSYFMPYNIPANRKKIYKQSVGGKRSFSGGEMIANGNYMIAVENPSLFSTDKGYFIANPSTTVDRDDYRTKIKDQQGFLTAGTYTVTVPDNYTKLYITCMNGAGGGGGGYITYNDTTTQYSTDGGDGETSYIQLNGNTIVTVLGGGGGKNADDARNANTNPNPVGNGRGGLPANTAISLTTMPGEAGFDTSFNNGYYKIGGCGGRPFKEGYAGQGGSSTFNDISSYADGKDGILGGGGGGGGGAFNAASQTGGGGAAGSWYSDVLDVNPGDEVKFILGAGGTAGSYMNFTTGLATNGGKGGDAFVKFYFAYM